MKNLQKGSTVAVLLITVIVILLGVIGYIYFLKPTHQVITNQQNVNEPIKPTPKVSETVKINNTTSAVNTNPVTEATTNPNMSGGKYPTITVVSPNGGERIPYGNITMAGDLSFTWKLQNENFKPTSEFAAYLIDENNTVIRSDFVKYINPLGKGLFTTSFAGEKNIQINKNYKIKVCDEVDTRIIKCDESDNYFTVVSQ